MEQVTGTPDLRTVAADLRAKVLAGHDLTKEEAMLACKYIRAGRHAAAEAKGKTKSSAPPRSAADLLQVFGGLKPVGGAPDAPK